MRAGRIHRMTREAGPFGTRVGEPSLDWPTVVARQHAIVRQFQPSVGSFEAKGVRVYLGTARFEDPRTLRLDSGDIVTGERILIAAGSEPVIPPVDGAALGITSDDLLFIEEFPADLVIVGAGVIGLEMAGAFSDLGARVTVIARESEILPQFDPDVAAYLRTILEVRGVTFRTTAIISGLSGRRGDVTVRFAVGELVREVRANAVCFATGRRWTPRMLGAEPLELAMGRLGLRTSAHLATSLPHVYAAGDAAGNMQLTPTAAYEGRVAARNALRSDTVAADLSVVPQTVFTTPEIARVGLTHGEAQRRRIACHVATHDMRGASNGVVTGEDDGYLKLVFEHGSERLLGVQMVSYAAAELIQLATLALRTGATADQLSAQLSVHPSHAERLIKITAHEYHEYCELGGPDMSAGGPRHGPPDPPAFGAPRETRGAPLPP
ncbi:MAG: NAD(P)/FAD-dependent oxidoreductase [Candidatus Rokubacteria bacterium]|nr:NAD(P)/FAD-dependent oxidoreductase [Candidatus Rokubacteria bacterium]